MSGPIRRSQQNNQQQKDTQQDGETSSLSQEDLLRRIEALENKVTKLESELSISKNVNQLLSQELDDLHQYQRRSCLVIDGINPQENETTEEINQKVKNVLTKNLNLPEDEVERELDKCHCLGPARAGKQSTILRFRSHGFKEKVYHKRKTIKGKKIKVKLSLTRHRTKTIKYAHRITENNNNVKFVFADMNGNLKMRLNDKIENKYVHEFKSIQDLHKLFDRLNWDIPQSNNHD